MRIHHRRRGGYAKKEETIKYRANEEIIASDVNVIDDEGKYLGKMSTNSAFALAKERGFDLVEVSPKEETPVCKFLNFGQFKYQKEKEMRIQKARAKKVDVKGVRLSVRMGQHDMDIRVEQAKQFLADGDKLKIEIMLRGREKEHGNLAHERIQRFLDEFVWSLRKEYGYMKVTIPHITKKDLYVKSGHWAKFSEELFKINTREGHEFAMKPMNCPHHTQIFDSHPRSYREMPHRYAETTMVYRDEQTGELSGLSRVRSITQDDAHVFCRKSQIEQEFFAIWDIIDRFYSAFGFELNIRLSTHDPDKMQKYLGTSEIWQEAEFQLRSVIEKRGKPFVEGKGEAAMYGPKIDFMGKDAIGRMHQVATIQLDFNMPEGFDLFCINENAERERIVMIHCAIMGSIERFLAVLIEHYAGAFPFWLAPVQIAILPVADRHIEFAQKLAEELRTHHLRVIVDDSAESVGKKIREAEKMKYPRMLVVGDKEVSGGDLTVRVRGEKDQLSIAKDKFIQETLKMMKERK